MSNQYIEKYQEEVDKTIEHFKTEINSLRVGRANPAMLDNVFVEAYGAKTPLVQLASISVPEVRVIRIDPFDKSIIKFIEKGIDVADIGLKATVSGDVIRVIIPQMTEESRKELVKSLKERHERARIALRSVRDKIKEEIVKGEKNNELTEDDRYKFVEELDKAIEGWNKQVDELASAKDQEIMTV